MRFKKNFTLTALALLATTSFCFADDVDKTVVGSSSDLLYSFGVSTLPTSPTLNIVAVPTGQWATALSGSFDASHSKKNSLLVQTSAVTAVITGDARFSSDTYAATLNWGGVQARVLLDCALPACDPTSDTVPAANLLQPGVIVLDQAAHFLLDGSDANTFRIAIDLAAGARAFNFYQTNFPVGKVHNVVYQVKFNANGLATSDNAVTGAIVAVAKRTMIIETVTLNTQP